MGSLPLHGRVDCTRCFSCVQVEFDKTTTGNSDWRITANPLAWGSQNAEIVVLGFSKGPTQKGALATAHHDEIAYKGSRLNVGKILAHIGLLQKQADNRLRAAVDREIANPMGRFHFGSLIRCTVERFEPKTNGWKGTGGGMLDRFVATDFGRGVAQNCTAQFLGNLPSQTKLIVMFGMGSRLNYVHEAYELFKSSVRGRWKWINEAAYKNETVTVVHVEHFASQGALIPNWLGIKNHPRSRLGLLAKSAVDEFHFTKGVELSQNS